MEAKKEKSEDHWQLQVIELYFYIIKNLLWAFYLPINKLIIGNKQGWESSFS